MISKSRFLRSVSLAAICGWMAGASAETFDSEGRWSTTVEVNRGQEHVFWVSGDPEAIRLEVVGTCGEGVISASKTALRDSGDRNKNEGVYVLLTSEDWAKVPESVDSVVFTVTVRAEGGYYDPRGLRFGFGHASGRAPDLERCYLSQDRRHATVDSHAVEYHLDVWKMGARVTDCLVQDDGCCRIPEEVDGVRVVAVKGDWFERRDAVTRLELPFPVTDGNASVLNAFPNLTSVTAQRGDGTCQSLVCENGAIYDAGKTELWFVRDDVRSLTLPASVSRVMDKAFAQASQLESLAIDDGNDSLVVVNDMICNKQKTAIVSALPYMTSLEFPANATTANWSSFQPCGALKTYHYSKAPLCCQPLSTTGFPEERLRAIETVTIGEDVTEIGNHAFEGFSGLCNVQIPNGVERIGAYAFPACSIGMLTVPKTVQRLGVGFFAGGILRLECPRVPFAAESGEAPCGQDDSSWLASVLDPASTYVICADDVAADWGNAIVDGGFNDPATSFSWNFDGWSAIARIEDERVIVDQLYCNKPLLWDGTETLTLPSAVGPFPIVEVCRAEVSGVGCLVIPEGYERIGNEAFVCLGGVRNVIIPSSVKSIGCRAFLGCGELESVTIPEGVTSIGAYAFSSCGIGMLTVPQSVRQLGERFFDGPVLRLECSMCRFVDEDGESCDKSDPMWLSCVLDPWSTYVICADDVAADWRNAIVDGGFNGSATFFCWNVDGWSIGGWIENERVIVDQLYCNEPLKWDGTETLRIPDAFGPLPVAEVRSVDLSGALENVVFPASVRSVLGGLSSVIESGTKTISFEGKVPKGFTDCLSELHDKSVVVRYPEAFADEWQLFLDENGAVRTAERPYADVGNIRYWLSWEDSSWTIVEIGFVPGLEEEPPHPEVFEFPTTLLGRAVKGIDGSLVGDCVMAAFRDTLRKVVIPEGYERIGSYAFQGCNIETLTVPRSVRQLGERFFDGPFLRLECPMCRSVGDPWWLSSILDPARTYVICAEDVAAGWRNAIVNGGFNDPATYFSWEIDGWSLGGWIENARVIVDQLYCNEPLKWDGTETLTLPSDVGSLPIVEVRSVEVGGGVGCLVIPEGYERIGNEAFAWRDLREARIPSSVTSIGASAFQGCNIETLTVPRSVRQLGERFFDGPFLRLECPMCRFVNWNGDPCDASEPWWLSRVLDPWSTYVICADDVAADWRNAIINGGFNDFATSFSWNFDGWSAIARIEDERVIVDQLYCNKQLLWDGTETLTLPSAVGPLPIVEVHGVGLDGALESVVFPASVRSVQGGLSPVIASGTETISFEGGVPKGFTDCLPELYVKAVVVRYPEAFADDWSVFVGEDGRVRFARPYADVGNVRYWLSWLGDAWSIDEVGFVPGSEGPTQSPWALTLPATLLGRPVWGIGVGASGIIDLGDGLREIVVPEGYVSIAPYVLEGCRRLESVTIPASVTSLDNVFAGCLSLRSIHIDEANPRYEARDGFLIEKELSAAILVVGKSGPCAIPDGVASVAYGAFANSPAITELTIPSSLQKFDADVVDECAELLSIVVAADNPVFKSVDGLLLDQDGTSLVACPGGLTEVVVPEGVRNVCYEDSWGEEMSSFPYCSKARSIFLPASTEHVAGGLGSVSLKEIRVDAENAVYKAVNGMLLSKDGTSLVFAPAGLTEVVVPEGVSRVSAGAFYSSRARSISLPASVEKLPAILGSSSLTEIHVDAANDFYSAENGMLLSRDGRELLFCALGLVEAIVPKGVTRISDALFRKSTKLSAVVIPDTVEEISERSFENCKFLKSVCFEGDAPAIVSVKPNPKQTVGIYGTIPKNGVIRGYVTTYVREGTSGWGDVPGTWCGRPITWWTDVEPSPIPEVDDNATVEQVLVAASGSKDEKVAENIQQICQAEGVAAGVELYNAYRDWATTVKGPSDAAPAGLQAVCDSSTAWTSFALDSDKLLEKNLTDEDLNVEEFKPAEDAGKFDFTVSVKDVSIGPKAMAKALKQTFGMQGATELVPSAFSESNVDIEFGQPEGGKLKFTARPTDKGAKSFFMKMNVK